MSKQCNSCCCWGLHLSITSQSSHASPASSFHHQHQSLDSFHQHSWQLGLRWFALPSLVLPPCGEGWRLGTTADLWWPPISSSNKHWTGCLCRKWERKTFFKKSVCVQLSVCSFSMHPCFYFETCAFIFTFSCFECCVKFLLERSNTSCFHANSPSANSFTCKSPEPDGKTGSVGIRQVENCTELH